jgi:hypothetical protein
MQRARRRDFNGMTDHPLIPSLSASEWQELTFAKSLLENPGLAARLANAIGAPLDRGFAMLPKDWSAKIHEAAQSALKRALELALGTMERSGPTKASELFHKVLVGASGGIGGAFGLAAIPIELPISTSIMLRSIADIARSEGHDVATVPIQLACLEVFALGGRSHSDDAAESTYWLVRAGLSKAVSDATLYLSRSGLAERGAPAIVRMISAIASRFGVIVSEQVAAKAIPVVGAIGGSMINVLFMDHFQDMARGHFIVKRLEAKYGVERVEEL